MNDRLQSTPLSITDAYSPKLRTALVLSGSNEGAPGNDVPMILRDTLGLNVKVVSGYPDSSAMFLAMERGEVHGRTVDLSTVRTFRSDWLKPNGAMRVLLQFARVTRHPDFPRG